MARHWAEVRWCSERCRRSKLTAADRDLERGIDEHLRLLGRGATLLVDDGEPARMAARRIAAAGRAVMIQGGRVVDPSTVKGPLQLRQIDPA